MDSYSDTFSAFIQEQLSRLSSPNVGMQLGVLVLAATVAWLTHRHLRDYFDRTLPATQSPLRQMLVHAAQIVVFPLTMLVGVLIGRGILTQTHWKVAVLNMALPLLLCAAPALADELPDTTTSTDEEIVAIGLRADAHGPAGTMADHVHQRGSVMVAFSWMHEEAAVPANAAPRRSTMPGSSRQAMPPAPRA